MTNRSNRVPMFVHYDFYQRFIEPSRKAVQKNVPFKVKSNVHLTQLMANKKMFDLRLPKFKGRKNK